MSNRNNLSSYICILLCLAIGAAIAPTQAKTTFEKMTNRDFVGSTYYTMQNVSLFECLGWCKDDSNCTSTVFSFVVNPFAALQETTCLLQRETESRKMPILRTLSNGNQHVIAATPQKASNLYFFNKLELQTENVCSRLWAFERFPNKKLRQRDRQQPFHAPSKEICQSACMNEVGFVCRSLEYNYVTQECTLSGHDRRSPQVVQLASQIVNTSPLHQHRSNDLIETPGVDYFENSCLLGEDICNESRIYDYAKVNLPLNRVAHYVELNYYPDKEMLVKSQAGCVRACTIEHEFICRSILFRSTFKQGQPNCALYHLDHRTFPDGAETFVSQNVHPLLDSGDTSAVYLEAVCNDSTVLPTTLRPPPSTININSAFSSTTPTLVISTSSREVQMGNMTTASSEDRYVTATSTLSPIHSSSLGSTAPSSIRLSTTLLPPVVSINPNPNQVPSNIHLSELPHSNRPGGSGSPHITVNQGGSMHRPANIQGGAPPTHLTIGPAPQPGVSGLIDHSSSGSTQIVASGSGPANHDQNCDSHGFCYDVSLKCTDTRMIVNVKTQRPFHGRVYALGRSETCNANVKNQNQFQLNMHLTGQECNTQSASGIYTNTIVLQHHNVVLTKADKVYHVRCTYETASRNVSFGMMPVKDMFENDINDRNQETISISATTDAPLPKINILFADGREASTVRIGDRLTFRVEIPENTPYGIFARSCIAMAKDGRSNFEIIDEHGCPVDHTIFPNFLPSSSGNALESSYEAFRFTESYGVIFQCNVKYCIGKCEPVNCGIGRDSVESWGRRKRSVDGEASGSSSSPSSKGAKRLVDDDMTLSREIVVLDLKDGQSSSKPEPDSGADMTSPQRTDDKPSKTKHRQSSERLAKESWDQSYCLTSRSIYFFIPTLSLILTIYTAGVAYYFSNRDPKISHIKHQLH